jgi:outer membrane biosynthesis protein TonB
MKRCPECEFVYEDEQNLCDMDGAGLVFDSRPLPGEENTSPQPLNARAKSSWRTVVIVALAGLALSSVLMVRYRLKHKTAPQSANHSAAEVILDSQSTPTPAPAPPAETATSSPSQSPITKVRARNGATPIVKPSSARIRSPAPIREQKKPEKKPEPENANQKKESRIGSILKKTGRILKKPFKL